MIIGSDKLDYNALRRYVNNKTGLLEYARSLVPMWAQHIPSIFDNQRYYVALNLRKVTSLNYATRKDMIETLVKDIHIRGAVSGFVTIHDVINETNKEALLEVLLDEQSDTGGH